MLPKVRLLEGIFLDSQEKGKDYLLYLDVDRLVAPCYEAISKDPRKPRYGGWESMEIAGHSIGHWLSAAAAMYQVTGDGTLREKLDYAIDELALIQRFDEHGYVSGFSRDCFDQVFTGEFYVDNFNLGGSWVPWYSLHKIYAGLIDAYQLAGNNQALEVVTKLSEWAYAGLSSLTDEQFQRMLICEHGAMNEVMADMYIITKEEKYLELAKRFCQKLVLDPLAKQVDELEGKHANTQIPKVVGVAKLYEITGEQVYRDMAEFFWHQVTTHRSYVIGGNSNREHFGAIDTEVLGVQTNESCNTYNMLKLTEHLFNWTKKSVYMDYYERALYNHILASQDPDSGMKAYFMSTEPGHFKVYCSPDDSFWCCTGTGMENPARYTRNIYSYENNNLYVNLFIASDLFLEDNEVELVQETSFPESDKTTLIFKEANGEALRIHIRVPDWMAGSVTVAVNGRKEVADVENGYLSINNTWTAGDRIEVDLPMGLHTYTAKDDPNKQAILYGPIVLAGALGKEKFPETDILADHQALDNHELIDVPILVTDEKDVNKWIHPVEGKALMFETETVGKPGDVKVTLIPFYALHHERYTIYWKVMDEQTFGHFVDVEKQEKEKMRRITVDEVIPGEQQPEVEHDMQSENSNSGYLHVVRKGWRDSRGDGFFSYTMAVDPNKPMYLLVTYYGSDDTWYVDGKTYERTFDLLIDGTILAQQRLKLNKPGELFDVCYEIPTNLTAGKEKVEVKFASTEGKAAGAVYGLRIINEKQ
ncbi:glycoside hydrolase family 127 protein [Aquibacillus koreensis]|uniref:Glycoside hydrolase family 127 protein n=2 Tax=Aquibacillus koreensis TaxID=279446 RepID=A0A9X3WIK8_9BACI|nr:glycoside hydrolase family 127 protein [Aquibacillus koreensis]MCT2535981.1 glycoside hydrolase family 127 protein [Aquibacillus koreensis]MDC3420437.1 glycoside hydrolase family 127 protein [Aquibacillus koreensis]